MLTGSVLIIVIALALVLIVIACAVLKWHPFFVLLIMAILLGIITGIPHGETLTVVIQGGASVFAGIGLIIAFGTVLGTILEKTGAAQTIAGSVMARAGKKRVLPGMSVLGAIVAIPVFCDSGFVILTNLAKSLAAKSGISFGAVSIALATGLYTTHVLVPPTPGPLAAAGNLDMNEGLGWIILLGLVVSVPSLITGYYFAKKFAARDKSGLIDLEEEFTSYRPRLVNALLPLVFPVVLIAAGSVINFFGVPPQTQRMVSFFCSPAIAILLGVICALLLLGRSRRKEWNHWIQHSLSQAGPIIFITIAGGALGSVLKATSLSEEFKGWVEQHQFSMTWLYVIAFALAAGLKTAQGSSTAALVIASSIISPLLIGLPAVSTGDKALLVLSIGAGAMTVSHANDSYFWVINQYAGIDTANMYRYFTRATFFMGLATLISCILLSLVI